MLDEIPASVWWEWMAFDRIEPFSDQRGDLQAAIIASTIAEAHRNKKKRTKPFKPADFMPEFGRKKRQSVDEMINIAAEITRAMGGKDLR